jgi:hypothetical protein
MTDLFDDEYWSNQFDITQDDLKRAAERLEREETPRDLKTISLRLITGRLEYGHDLSPAVLSQLTGTTSVHLWDPTKEWQLGEMVIVAHQPSTQTEYSSFVGIVVQANENNVVQIRIDELKKTIKFAKAIAGSNEAQVWCETVRKTVERKLQSTRVGDQAEGILLKHGNRILSRLSEALQSDPQFTGFEGKWYLTRKLPVLEAKALQKMHQHLRGGAAGTLDEIASSVESSSSDDEALLRLAVYAALQNQPERFENTGTPARPQWKARMPEPAQAEVLYYAYDPKTYEILCQPGQRLTQKQALRLQELGLYEHVVTFAA